MGLSIPEKGPDVTWTDEQWKAIWATGQDTLVSAAAGSGKTAVLITRMIEKVISSENPIDVDELLVVTFTNASAAEMRHRMAEALEKEIAKNPRNQHLRRQLSLVNKAQISTLHSFCLAIVRQYAYLIEIDPGFRIANEGESALLRDDVLAQTLEEAYDQEDEAKLTSVYRLVDSFTSDRDDQAIETLISKLYDTSRVHPEPIKWLHSLPKQYDLPENITIDELNFIEPLKDSIRFSLEEALAHIEEMRQYSLKPDGPYPYGETAQLDFALLEEAKRIINYGTWQEAYDYFAKIKWDRIATVKKDSCDPDLQEKAKKKRDQAKDIIKQLKESFFLRKPERLLEEIRLMGPIIETLVELTESFSEKFKIAKLQRGLVDFSDLEHYALEILTVEEDGKLLPSPVALDFKEKFKEVLVDEYQDTNMLQETILQLVKSGSELDGNLFMVGDVKQSIYRFRLAEPMLFLNKYNVFEEEPISNGLKIDLNANFRSRKEVLHGTNFIFEQIMGETVGEIFYDEKAGLKPGAPYNDIEMPIELAILYEEQEDEVVEVDEEAENAVPIEEDIKKSQAEARFIIKRIRELIDSGATVYDAKQKDPAKRVRPMQYSDIVILMRSMTWSNDLVEEFKSAGIPLYAESSKGYFEALEVMVMLNILKVVDNPYQDIPLASVLRAPFIGCTENELAKIRLVNRKVPYYEAVKQFVTEEQSGINADTAEKLQQFLTQLEYWRNLARRGSLSELIWKIYIDTNYYEMVGAMANGKQRQANLRTLHDRAQMYEKTSFRGLFRFLRFIDRMRSRGDDLGVAKSIGEKDNVVRLVTIHSSKGLEYPVVFVAGLGRNFNQMDFNNAYLFDQEYGLAVKAIDPDDRIMYTSLPFLAMKEKKILELKAEEMRVLYVAMTRAKERLILIGTVKDWDKVCSKWCEVQHLPTDVMLPDYLRARAKNYLDWIGPAVARHQSFETYSDGEYRPIEDSSKWLITPISNSFFMHALHSEEVDKQDEFIEQPLDPVLYNQLKKRFTTPYAFTNSVTKKSKTSVSEIKRIENLERMEEPNTHTLQQSANESAKKRPLFLQQKSLSATEIGTVVHTVMQHIPQKGFSHIEEVQDYLSVLVDRKLLTEEEIQVVDPERIIQFFLTNIGKRFTHAKQVHREIPFTLSRRDEEGDSQIVQGILDCLFEDEDGKWVLLDYKTDKILPSFKDEPYLTNEMNKRYGVQLRIYSEAIESILQVKVDEKILYLYNAQKEIQLN